MPSETSIQALQDRINEARRSVKGLDEVNGLSGYIIQAQEAMTEALDECQKIVDALNVERALR